MARPPIVTTTATITASALLMPAPPWRWPRPGRCLPTERTISATSDTLDAAVGEAPADGSAGSALTTSLTLDPSVEFTEYIEVKVTFDHPSARDLQIQLRSPSGTVSTLAYAATRNQFRFLPGQPVAFPDAFRFGSARHVGETAAGVWTLTVTDHLRGNTRLADLVEHQGLRPRGNHPERASHPHGHRGRALADRGLDGAPGPAGRLDDHDRELRPPLHPQQRHQQGQPRQLDRGDGHRHRRHGHVRDHGAGVRASSTTCRCGP